MGSPRRHLIWAALAIALIGPILLASFSPYLAFRQPIYIAAGFAGIIAMSLLLLQPLLIRNALPGISPGTSRRVHRATGVVLLAAVILHVAGLWITSPPDVIDALTFTSPTPFSAWGVIAMWAVFASALLAGLRATRRLRPARFRVGHKALAVVIVVCSVAHALLIEGAMEVVSKTLICGAVLAATAWLFVRR